jgi:hypothetical protein
MGKSLVGFGHFMGIFPFFHDGPFFFGAQQNLFGQPGGHGLARLPSGDLQNPLKRNGLAPFRSNFVGHLVGCAADPAGADFKKRTGILDGAGENHMASSPLFSFTWSMAP